MTPNLTGNEPVHALPRQVFGTGEDYIEFPGQPGITLRQHYAGLAMQGILSKGWAASEAEFKEVARRSVQMADALITALNAAPHA